MNMYEERLNYWLKKHTGVILKDLDSFDSFPFALKYKILKEFVEWACQPQNIDAIELGRKRVTSLDKKWLKDHLIDVAKDTLDLSDEWEYRRFVELVMAAIPDLKDKVVEMGMLSDNEDIREAADDYNNMESL